jgi:hypothetical protein
MKILVSFQKKLKKEREKNYPKTIDPISQPAAAAQRTQKITDPLSLNVIIYLPFVVEKNI